MKDMKAKFKVTDVIHYMNDNKPKSSTISGYTIKVGKTRDGSYNESTVKEGEFEITYHLDKGYDSVKEADAYKSLNDLKEAVFAQPLVTNE